MEAKSQTVRVYETRDGTRPFDSWLRKIRDSQARQRVRTRINRLRLGNFGDHRSVGDGVCELRIDYGPGYRIYYGRDGAEIVILLIGGDKRTQHQNIETAKAYWADYQARTSEDKHGTS
jgi:putative addiction module killer protein